MESVFRLMGKAANVLLSVVLVLVLVPASAFAGEGCAPSAGPNAAVIDAAVSAREDAALSSDSNSTGGNVDQTESENKATPGWTECGTCEWMIDDAGLLTVRPLPGLACGKLASWGIWTDVPWYSQRKSITAARVDSGVSVETCRYLFYGCSSLASVDLSGLDTSEVTSLSSMFTDCSSLTSLDLSSLDTSNVTSLSFMFEGCASLTSLDLTSFDISSATSLSYMFSGCSSLETLDLSSLNTSNATDMRFLFSGCSSLSTVYVSGLFTTDEVRSSDFMFAGCASLVGGAGTTYSAAHTDAAYAHIDAGTNDPGYFTGRRPKGEGDVNGNGVLNVVDAQAAYEIATTDYYENRSDYADMCHRADVTRNGSVDAADAFAIQRAALRGWDTF